jgi:signal transduction histidine kinase
MSTMTTTAPARVRRDPEAGIIGGVCAGLARRLGIDPIILRLGFVVITAAGGFGVLIYVILWVALPSEQDAPARRLPRLSTAPGTWEVAAGIGLLVLAALLVARNLGAWVGDALVWPVVLVAAGGALLWRESGRPMPRAAVGPAALGAALVVGGGLVFLYLNDALRPARDVVLAVVVVLVAGSIILAPWWLRLWRGLTTEREARIRSQERAEVAAHLHDSVLQTLALVQRRADDPRAVGALARRQERELRAWLNGQRAPGTGDTLVAALERVAVDVEEAHGVAVEIVTVGDRPLDDRTEALAAAAREAVTNAAKFAGDVNVYAEVGDGLVQVFVRDRGPGFDPDTVPADRRGLRESIVGRMQRHGGRATVTSRAGEGTEVELELP